MKICGVTTGEDLLASCALGADFIGFNFYPKSPRYVSPERAADLRRKMPDGVAAVGVFVNTPTAQMQTMVEQVGLDLVQFHGDETPADVAPLSSLAIRALRVGADFDLLELEAWRDCWGVLFDGPAEGLYGGTGESWAYDRVADSFGGPSEGSMASDVGAPRTFLAGGLTPYNVASAVRQIPGLFAVDVCSGVEAAPGRKDHELLEQFFERVSLLAIDERLSDAYP